MIDNAIKFSPEYSKIKVDIIKNNMNTTVLVSDEGNGLSEEEVKHIFDRFYQGDTSHSTKGNGLGLTLAKKTSNSIKEYSTSKALAKKVLLLGLFCHKERLSEFINNFINDEEYESS